MGAAEQPLLFLSAAADENAPSFPPVSFSSTECRYSPGGAILCASLVPPSLRRRPPVITRGLSDDGLIRREPRD